MAQNSIADVRRRGFSKLMSVKDALSSFFEQCKLPRLAAEIVPVHDALGRVLAEDVVCQRDVPPFNRSAVDGFAVRSEDTFGCSPTNPVVLQVIGTSYVANMPEITLGRHQAMKIMTGAPMPHGSDAVVMIEYTELTREDKVEVYRTVTPLENVSLQGEDVKKGEVVLRAGYKVEPPDIAILAALGIRNVKVKQKPKIGVISTGNELADLSEEISEWRIFDSNRPALIAMVKLAGGDPVDLGIAADNEYEIAMKLKTGLMNCDVVLVSGGSSVGEHDLLPSVVNSLGRPGLLVHGVAMRPGKPVALAAIENKPVIIFPGLPVAAMIAFEVFAQPIIERMLGLSASLPLRVVKARCLRRLPSSLGNRTFARVIVRKMDEGFVFEPLSTSGSGIISTLVKANGIVTIPENKEGVEEGELVEVRIIRPIEGLTT